MAGSSGERRDWGAVMRAALTERLGLKTAALLLSLLLWLVVEARRPAEMYVDLSLEPVLPDSAVLREPPPRLRALVAGRAASLVRLLAAPPVIHQTIGGSTPDSIVLQLSPADLRLSRDLSDDLRVLDIQPRSVTLHFAPRADGRHPARSR